MINTMSKPIGPGLSCSIMPRFHARRAVSRAANRPSRLCVRAVIVPSTPSDGHEDVDIGELSQQLTSAAAAAAAAGDKPFGRVLPTPTTRPEDALEFLKSSNAIWNTDWQAQMAAYDRAVKREQRQQEERDEPAPLEPGPLDLATSRFFDDVTVDMSEELQRAGERARAREAERQAEQARIKAKLEAAAAKAGVTRGSGEAAVRKAAAKQKYNYAPTRREQKRWADDYDKAEKFNMFDTKKLARQSVSPEEIEAERQASLERYEALKVELQITTLLAGLVGTGAAAYLGDRDVAISFGLGFLGSFMYLRGLTRSTDGQAEAGGAGRGGGGAARLAVPLVLIMLYNRWNELGPEQLQLELQMIPMLLGLFTYKVAALVRAVRDFVQPAAAAPSPWDLGKPGLSLEAPHVGGEYGMDKYDASKSWQG